MGTQQWYYRKGNKRFGPVSGSEIKQLAQSGQLEPTDLLRGVGMTEWVAAAKVKGLFKVAQPEPKQDDELGLAPEQPVATPSTPRAPAPKTQPVAAEPPPFTPPPTAMETPVAPGPVDPYALANDPFAALTAGASASGPSPFDNLVTLNQQGAAAPGYVPASSRDRGPQATGFREETSISFDAGPALKIVTLAAPFAVFAVVGYVGGIIVGLLPIRLIGIVVGIVVAKVAGVASGNCMLKAEVKNEVFALAYGGVLGIFLLYLFLGAYFWAQINGEADKVRKGKSELLSGLVVAAEEETAATETPPNGEGQGDEPAEPGVVETAAIGEKAGEGEEAGTEAAPDGEENEELTTLKKEKPAEFELLARIFSGKGISVLESCSPRRIIGFSFAVMSGDWIFFWLINGGVLIFYTAQATWAANCGYEQSENPF